MNEVVWLLTQGASIQQIMSAAQSMLGAGAMVSKLLWPVRNRGFSKRRAAYLRTILSVDSLELRTIEGQKGRELRNNFEHLDERLDDLFEESPNRHIADYIIGDKSIIGGNVSVTWLRQLDPERAVLSLLDQEVDLKDLQADLDRLWHRTGEWLAGNRA
jgi:hypothetical protein